MNRFKSKSRLAASALILAWPVFFLFTSLARSVEPLPPLTADYPALDPAQEKKIRALITQLGHTEWAKRQDASESLRRIGEPSLPLLQEALSNADAEIQARAGDLIKTIAPPVQFQDETIICSPGGLRITGNFVNTGRLVISGGTAPAIIIKTTAKFPFKGRDFLVTRQMDGTTVAITIEITEPADGEPTRRVIEAAGEEDLKKKEPEIFKIYSKKIGDLAERQARTRANYSEMTGIK